MMRRDVQYGSCAVLTLILTVVFVVWWTRADGSDGSDGSNETTLTQMDGPVGRPLAYYENAIQELCQESHVECIPLEPQTHEGRHLQLVRFRRNAVNVEHRTLVVGGLHAREWISPETALRLGTLLADELSSNLNVDLVIIANPDGYHYSVTRDRMWRKNRNPNDGHECVGVDLNRNWNGLNSWGGPHSASTKLCHETYIGTSAYSEPEVNALLPLVRNASVVWDLHAYTGMVFAPYSCCDTPHPRADEAAQLCQEVGKDAWPTPRTDQTKTSFDRLVEAGGVLSCGDWENDLYRCSGAMVDDASLGMLIELGDEFHEAPHEAYVDAVATRLFDSIVSRSAAR